MNFQHDLKTEIFAKFDAIRSYVDSFKLEPEFSKEFNARNNRYQNIVAEERNNLLRVMAKLTAYSNNAPSDAVKVMLEVNNFERIFHGFDLTRVAQIDPNFLVENEWDNIKVIRFKKKIAAIIRCASLLKCSNIDNSSIESFF